MLFPCSPDQHQSFSRLLAPGRDFIRCSSAAACYREGRLADFDNLLTVAHDFVFAGVLDDFGIDDQQGLAVAGPVDA